MDHLAQASHNQIDMLRIVAEKETRKAAKKRLQNGGKPLKRGRKKEVKQKKIHP